MQLKLNIIDPTHYSTMIKRSKKITLLTQSKSRTETYLLECWFDHMLIQHHPSVSNILPPLNLQEK